MTPRTWADEKVAQAQRRRPSANMLVTAAQVAESEHQRAVRIIKRLKQKAYFVEDTMDADQFDAYIAALDDVLAALERGRK